MDDGDDGNCGDIGNMMQDMRRDQERVKEMERRRNSKREVRRRQEMEERDKFVEQKEFIPITEDKGVQKRIIQMGLGDLAEKGFVLDAHLECRLPDGTIFFNTIKDNNNMSPPIKIHVLRRDVIKGVDLGLLTMKQSEISEFKITAAYAYGEKGTKDVPPNSEIIVKVDIRNMAEPNVKITSMTSKERITKSNRLKDKGIQDFKDDEYKDAIRHFENAYKYITYMDDDEVEFSVENADRIVNLLCNKSNCLNKLEKYEDSIKNLEFAIEIKPNHPKSYYIRGVIIVYLF